MAELSVTYELGTTGVPELAHTSDVLLIVSWPVHNTEVPLMAVVRVV